MVCLTQWIVHILGKHGVCLCQDKFALDLCGDATTGISQIYEISVSADESGTQPRAKLTKITRIHDQYNINRHLK